MLENGSAVIAAVREIMDRDVGVVRNGAGLSAAIEKLGDFSAKATGTGAKDIIALASLIAQAALNRAENRGAHFRSDAGPKSEPPGHSMSRW